MDPKAGDGFDAWRESLWQALREDGTPVPSTGNYYRAVSDGEFDAAIKAGEFRPLLGDDLYITADPDRLAGGAYGGKGAGRIITIDPAQITVHETTSQTMATLRETATTNVPLSAVTQVWQWDAEAKDHVLVPTSPAEAVQSAQDTAARLVETDLQLTQTNAARDWMGAEDSVTGYERLADAGACQVCDGAADGTVYHTDDLMPIHEHCGCGVVPVTDPSAHPERTSADAQVTEDPEIGPRLADATGAIDATGAADDTGD